MSEGANATTSDRSGKGFTTDDLSSEIIGAVERLRGDLIKCARVGENRYRCNWWVPEETNAYDNPGMRGGQLGTTHRVRKSQYLGVTRAAGGGLQIQVISTSKE